MNWEDDQKLVCTGSKVSPYDHSLAAALHYNTDLDFKAVKMEASLEKPEGDDILFPKFENVSSDTNDAIKSKDFKSFPLEPEVIVKSESHIKLENEELNFESKDEIDLHMKATFGSCMDSEDLQKEEVIPNDPSRVNTSSDCNYQIKYKNNLQTHILIHQAPTQGRMFKCTECSYQHKIKKYLVCHMLVHVDPSQTKMFKCKECSYQCKRSGDLRKHSLLHKSPSLVRMFKCKECSYETKFKTNLHKHMLVHKDPSPADMFKCTECSYQSKYKSNLKIHTVVHKDRSLLQMFKCEQCNFQCKRKGELKSHSQVHKKPSEGGMFECNECSYQSKHKRTLQKHMAVHKEQRSIYPQAVCARAQGGTSHLSHSALDTFLTKPENESNTMVSQGVCESQP